MRELFTSLFVFAAAFMLWRTVRPHRHNSYQVATSQGPNSISTADLHIYKWPSIGLFKLETADRSRYQTALKMVTDGAPISPAGALVIAQLHTGGDHTEIWKPVEIRVQNERVGFLSSGDASRFLRRLAYEGHSREVTCCDARITLTGSQYDIRLDLKEFRH